MGNVDVDSLMPEIETGDAPQELPDANLNVDAPADKEPQPRDNGKFAGKDKPKEPEAKAPAKEEAAKPPEPSPKPESRTIPLAAYLEDKNKWAADRKALEERLSKLESPPKPPDAPPEDPKAYADFKVKAALEELAGTKKEVQELKQTTQQGQQVTEEMRFSRQLETAEAMFIRENPDYHEALEHVRDIRRKQLQVFTPGMNIDQINAQIGREEFGMAVGLAREGRNPVIAAYELARAYGYQRKEALPKEELPKVPGQRQLPPDQTLGTGATTDSDPKDQEESDPFEDAFREMFGRRKVS